MAENQNPNQNQKPKKFNFGNIGIILVAALFVFAIVYASRGCQRSKESKSLTEIIEVINTSPETIDKIIATPKSDSSVAESYEIDVYFKDSKIIYYTYLNNATVYSNFVDLVGSKNIDFTYVPGSTFNIFSLLIYLSILAGVMFLIVII